MVDPISAEARAIESGRHAWLQEDGTFLVASQSRPGMKHRVRCEAVMQGGRWRVRFCCECEAGRARPGEFVACWHGALVGRRLERLGLAAWENGLWWLSPRGVDAIAKPKGETKPMGTVKNNWSPGTVTSTQLSRMRFAAKEARLVNGAGEVDERWLLVLAMAERNRTRARDPRRGLGPIVGTVGQLSSYEATILTRRLVEARGGPPPSTCARCARIGLEPRTPCMHDIGERGQDREESFRSRERARGRIT